MTAQALLDKLRSSGCSLVVDGDKLLVRGPLTDELRREIRRHKPELMALLRPQTKALFPYSLPETLGIGDVDPLDFRFDVASGKWVLDLGWWKRLGERRKLH